MRSALVTGASTGIGRATALRLDAAGWRVFAGVRREADADSLREAGSERLAPLMLDVTDAGQIAAAAEQIAAELGDDGLDGLVNNAGIGVPGPLETMPMEDFRRQVEVNMIGHVAVTKAMLPRDPARPRPDRLHQLDRRPHRLPAQRRLPRRQVRDRGRRRRLPPGAEDLGHLGLDRRAGLDQDADLGAQRTRDRRPARAGAGDRAASTASRSPRSAGRAGNSASAGSRPSGSPPGSSTRSPRAVPAPATWSASTPSSRRARRSSPRPASGIGSSPA